MIKLSTRKTKQKREKRKLEQFYFQYVCNYGPEKNILPKWSVVNGNYIATNITTIRFKGCLFTSDIAHWISLHLPYLQNLNIVNCETVTNEIKKIESLVNVCITGKEFKIIPEGLSELPNLKFLSLSDTSIEFVPDFLSKLSFLNYLTLNGTMISEIPDFIGSFSLLRHLNISGLTLNRIPKSLLNLNLPFIFESDNWKLSLGINLNQVRLKEQDISIFSKDREFVEYYLNSPNNQKLNEGKVIFLGDGFVGKTFIIERILNHDNLLSEDYTTKMTEGIRIRNFGDDFKIKFWDFGGEQIAHSMHRCFLTQRTLYVIVLSAREENYYSIINYWMRTVECFAPGSKVVIVINKMDEFPYCEINDNELKARYNNILKIFKISALKDSKKEFSGLSSFIISQAHLIFDEYGSIFPSRWIPIKNELENMSLNYIVGDDFDAICDKYDQNLDPNRRAELLSWFNDLGVVFSYNQNQSLFKSYRILSNYRILKPIWLINAVYAIIFNAKQSPDFKKGIISYEAIFDIVVSKKCGIYTEIQYDELELPYILEVMRKFKISHKINDNLEFIPSVCASNESLRSTSFEQQADCLRYEIEYDYLPNDIIHRFIIKNYEKIESDSIWLCGAVFNFESLACKVMVKKALGTNKIVIIIKKESDVAEPRALLKIVREEIKDINDTMSVLSKKDYILYKNPSGLTFSLECSLIFKCMEKGIYRNAFSDITGKEVDIIDFNEVLSLMYSPTQIKEKDFGPLVSPTTFFYNSNVQINGRDGTTNNHSHL